MNGGEGWKEKLFCAEFSTLHFIILHYYSLSSHSLFYHTIYDVNLIYSNLISWHYSTNTHTLCPRLPPTQILMNFNILKSIIKLWTVPSAWVALLFSSSTLWTPHSASPSCSKRSSLIIATTPSTHSQLTDRIYYFLFCTSITAQSFNQC